MGMGGENPILWTLGCPGYQELLAGNKGKMAQSLAAKDETQCACIPGLKSRGRGGGGRVTGLGHRMLARKYSRSDPQVLGESWQLPLRGCQPQGARLFLDFLPHQQGLEPAQEPRGQ